VTEFGPGTRWPRDERERWAPLEGFARAVPGIDPDEWMFMGICDAEGRHEPMWQYKHNDTRRYLHLDIGGHAWDHTVAVVDPDDGHLIQFDNCQVRAYRDVAEALAEHQASLDWLREANAE
jgi:hypothetical protein